MRRPTLHAADVATAALAEELYKFLESFQTPEGTRDLKRLLSSVDFPVYVLVNKSLSFPLLGVNISAKVAEIIQVCSVFVSPSYTEYTQTVMVCQLNQEAFLPDLQAGLLEYHLLRCQGSGHRELFLGIGQ